MLIVPEADALDVEVKVQPQDIDQVRPAYRERYYRGYHNYDSPCVYSERLYRRGPQVYERDSYRWRDRDSD